MSSDSVTFLGLPPAARWLASGLLLLVISVGCGDRPAQQPIHELPPPLRDLSDSDPVAVRQIRDRHHFLTILLDRPEAAPADLAWGFGELAKVYHAYLDIDRARACYQSARRLDPKAFEWTYLLAFLERTEGRFESSSALLEAALVLEPDDIPARMWLGQNALDVGRRDQAIGHFEAILARAPRHAQALFGLGRSALERGDTEAAAAWFEQVLAEQPDATTAHYALGQALQRLGKGDKAREHLEKIPSSNLGRQAITFDDPLVQQVNDLRDSAQTHARLGMRALTLNRWHAAIRAFQRALVRDPKRPDVRYNLAAALVRAGRRQEASAHLETLLTDTPDYARGYLLRARLHTADGALSEAALDRARAYELDPALRK